MKKILGILIIGFTVFAQSPRFDATYQSSLAWTPNDASDGVTFYTVYSVVDGRPMRLRSVTSPLVELRTLLTTNGVYTLFVTASNPSGEGPASTNIVVQYSGRLASAPGGLMIK